MTEKEFLAVLGRMNKPDYPQWLYEIFPLTFIFYRQNAPKMRKKKAGWNFHIDQISGHAPRYRFKKTRLVAFKMDSTAAQNMYSYVVCVIKDPNGYGTVRRSLQHKGYGKLAGAVYATDQEFIRQAASDRYLFRKYRFLHHYYEDRGEQNPELEALLNRIATRCPSHSAQMKLF